MSMGTHDARHLSPEAQEDLRRRVVHAVVDQDMRPSEAVRVFGVGRTSIHNWVKAHRIGGKVALRSKPRGRPRVSRLKGHQAATTVRLITDHCPDQLKMPFVLWTREAVQQLLADRFELEVSVWTVGRYLKHWGLTPQKPLRRAYEQNPEAVERWIKGEYPAIAAQAKREKAVIHWGDEMGLRSDHQTGRSYGRRGETPVIPGTGQRFGCNMISTITNRGELSFMIFKERFTAAVMLKFLGRLIRQSRHKVFLILDGHPVHHSRRVARWLEEHQDQIRVFFLPGYSPELNPDELLNQDVKSNALGRQRPTHQRELMHLIRTYLWSTQRCPDIIRNYFREKHVTYAAA
jgi:transposase